MIKKQHFVALLGCVLVGMFTLLACDSITISVPAGTLNTPRPYDAAQSTLVYGQNQLEELQHQATLVGMDIAQAANAAGQATLDHSERQRLELAYQETAVSLNMAQAAATQQSIAEQTQMVWNAAANAQSQAATATYAAYSLMIAQTEQAQASLDDLAAKTAQALVVTQQFDINQTQIAWNGLATAQSQAATATYSAYNLNVTQTAQAQAALNVKSTDSARAKAAYAAYSLTATPRAAIQAEIVRLREETARRAIWGEFVVTPLTAILVTLVVVLLIVGGVRAYGRLLPLLEMRLRTIFRYNDSPLLIVDGMLVDANPRQLSLVQRELRQIKPPQPPVDETPQIEIVGPTEPSVTNWITEAEKKLPFAKKETS